MTKYDHLICGSRANFCIESISIHKFDRTLVLCDRTFALNGWKLNNSIIV